MKTWCQSILVYSSSASLRFGFPIWSWKRALNEAKWVISSKISSLYTAESILVDKFSGRGTSSCETGLVINLVFVFRFFDAFNDSAAFNYSDALSSCLWQSIPAACAHCCSYHLVVLHLVVIDLVIAISLRHVGFFFRSKSSHNIY